jgi:hypothetical protein
MTTPDETHRSTSGNAASSAETTGPKYCSQCGAVWSPDWNVCPRCAAQAASRSIEYPGIGPALSLYFTLLGLSLAGIVAIACGARAVETEFVLLGLQAAIIVAWCAAGRRQVLAALTARVHPGWFLAAAILAGCTFSAAAVFLTFLHRELDMPLLQIASPIFQAGYGWPTVILSSAVMPAVFEEIAFRGVILTSLSRVMGSAEAAVVSALLFMVLHLSVPSFPNLFLLGLALAYLRLKSGSLLPGMLLHFTHNLLCVVAERHVGPQFFL